MNTITSPDVADRSDDELMARLDCGEPEAPLRELQRRHLPFVRGIVGAIVCDPRHANELAHEVFAKVFFKSHLYQIGTDFRGWLATVARNHARTALRKQSTGVPTLPAIDDDDSGHGLASVADRRVQRELEERELLDALDAAVTALPDRYREVFRLCVEQGVSYRDAATRLAVPTGTVAIRIMRARQRLFKSLSHHIGHVRRPPACLQCVANN